MNGIYTTPGGHTFIADEYFEPESQIDNWRVAHGYHNGPECSACGESWCEHCESKAGRNVYLAMCPAYEEPQTAFDDDHHRDLLIDDDLGVS